MTDITDHGTTGPAADAPAATDELEAARQRVRDLEAAQQAEAEAAAAAAATAAEDAHAAELTPEVPEEPNAVNDLPDGTRGVIAEIFDHLGTLARTLGEHAREIAGLHAAKDAGGPVPAASTLSKDRGFALDTERPASMAADEHGVEPGFAGPGTGDGPAPG